MSHPRSDLPPKDNTENSSSDATKRAPKRPRNSKRPMDKTISFGVQSPVNPKADIPRMGEQDLWKALDGAITQATQEDATREDTTQVTQPNRKSHPSRKAASPKKGMHKTQLGMPAISPLAPSKPKPIPVTSSPTKKPATDDLHERSRDTKAGPPQTKMKQTSAKASPKEAFMKTIAQAPIPNAATIEESGTEMISADELLEIEPIDEEESTVSANIMSESETKSGSEPITAQDALQDKDTSAEGIELTTLPPDLVEENEPVGETPEITTAKTERLASLGPTLKAAAETTTSPIQMDTTEEEEEEAVFVEEADDLAGEELLAEDNLIQEKPSSKKTWILVGSISAVILGALAVVFFVFLKPYFFPSSALPVASPAQASQTAQAPSGQNRQETVAAAITTPAIPPTQIPASIPAEDAQGSIEDKNNAAQKIDQKSQTQEEISPDNAPSGEKTSPSPNEEEPPSKEAPPSKDVPPTEKPVPIQDDAQDDTVVETEKTDTQPSQEPLSPTESLAAPTAQPGMVTITLNGLPTGATVNVDGRKVDRRFTVPQSENSIKVEVKRTGFKTKVKRVIPLRDKEIRIKLKKKQTESKSEKNSKAS